MRFLILLILLRFTNLIKGDIKTIDEGCFGIKIINNKMDYNLLESGVYEYNRENNEDIIEYDLSTQIFHRSHIGCYLNSTIRLILYNFKLIYRYNTINIKEIIRENNLFDININKIEDYIESLCTNIPIISINTTTTNLIKDYYNTVILNEKSKILLNGIDVEYIDITSSKLIDLTNELNKIQFNNNVSYPNAIPSNIPEYCYKYRISSNSSEARISEDIMFQRPPPALLLSYPGSGNTWQRLVIESLLGYCTGSIYTDIILSKLFVCEPNCGIRMPVIKGHPEDFRLVSSQLRINLRSAVKKCRPGLIHSFSRIILITRDPFRSLLSHFQLAFSGNHTGSKDLSRRGYEKFVTFMIEESMIMKETWNHVLYPLINVISSENFLLLRYEDFFIPMKRLISSKNILSFLQYPEKFSEERVECAFLLGERPEIHRSKKMNATLVYSKDKKLACSVWNNIKYISGNLSYPIWPGLTCNGTEDSFY